MEKRRMRDARESTLGVVTDWLINIYKSNNSIFRDYY